MHLINIHLRSNEQNILVDDGRLRYIFYILIVMYFFCLSLVNLTTALLNVANGQSERTMKLFMQMMRIAEDFHRIRLRAWTIMSWLLFLPLVPIFMERMKDFWKSVLMFINGWVFHSSEEKGKARTWTRPPSVSVHVPKSSSHCCGPYKAHVLGWTGVLRRKNPWTSLLCPQSH